MLPVIDLEGKFYFVPCVEAIQHGGVLGLKGHGHGGHVAGDIFMGDTCVLLIWTKIFDCALNSISFFSFCTSSTPAAPAASVGCVVVTAGGIVAGRGNKEAKRDGEQEGEGSKRAVHEGHPSAFSKKTTGPE